MHTRDISAKALVLFDHYAEMPTAELSSALAKLQREDAEVCVALMRLLAADEKAYSLVSPLHWQSVRDRTVPEDAAAADRIWPDGTCLGPWRVDGVIGLGGMGVVYAAHRVDGLYEREVALKTIRAGMTSPELQQAFAKERSHLAKLEHPSIVALYDAGVAEDGQPWLAMQRVHGKAIDEWCDAHRLDLRGRVRLLIDACEAIGYAHAQSVLHQDIKPSNLLVTEGGKVKLLDFGLSALSTPQADGVYSRLGMSSAYAAPEVFDGAPPSVGIDVYALGVVLYRLFCDGWPRTPQTMTAFWRVGDDAARGPSALAADASPESVLARRSPDAQALSQALRGDLDAIALRCVNYDPNGRYACVADLRADLKAWLERRPVTAREGSWIYRGSRFLRRNALAATGAGALAAVSLLGGLVLYQQRQRAYENAENGEILSQLFEKSLGTATLTSIGNAPLNPEALLHGTERQLRASAGSDKQALLSRGLDALARAWLVRANYARAARLLEESKALSANNPLQTARTNAVLAQLFNLQADSAKAERLVQEGLTALPSLDGIEDDLIGLDLRMQLARARWGQGDTQGSIRMLDQAVKAAESLGESARPALAELLGQRGYMHSELFMTDLAEQDLRRALAIIGDRNPAISNKIRIALASTLNLLGNKREAHLLASEALVSSIRIFGSSHPETALAWTAMGKSWYYNSEDSRRAGIALDRGETILTKQMGPGFPGLSTVLTIRSGLAYQKGDIEDALEYSRRALGILDRAYGPRHESTLKRQADVAFCLLYIGQGKGGVRQAEYFREAEGMLSTAIRTGEQQGLPMVYARDEYVMLLLYLNRLDEADRQTQLSIREAFKVFGTQSDYSAPTLMSLIRVRTAQGRYNEAAAVIGPLIARLPAEAVSPYEHYIFQELLLDIEIARGDAARIRTQYSKIRSIAERYGFMGALNVKQVPGFGPYPKRN